MSTDRQIVLEKIINAVNKTAPDSEIYLYGSRARGDARELSDWDLLILLQGTRITFDFEKKVLDELYEVEIETGEIISPLIYTKNDWVENHSVTPLFESIQKEGIRIR
ncbi:MAG TPA: nucleotidyltransferase domain-containing protein [Bacteroidales bacterium]|nr:nucleotidyltransferase domain-containing protein [Bacteroidales bacterium]